MCLFNLSIFVLQCVLCACLCFVYVFLSSVCGFFSCSLVYVLVCLVCVRVCVFACIPLVCLGTVCVFCMFICRLCLCLSSLRMLMHMCIHMFTRNIIDVCTNVSVLSLIFINLLCAYFFSFSLRIPHFSVISHFLFPNPCWTLSLSFFHSRCLSLSVSLSDGLSVYLLSASHS